MDGVHVKKKKKKETRKEALRRRPIFLATFKNILVIFKIPFGKELRHQPLYSNV